MQYRDSKSRRKLGSVDRVGKRVAISLLVILIIGSVAVWVHLRRRENSIEYHKKAYVTIRPESDNVFRRAYRSLESAGLAPRSTPDYVKRDQHRDALVRLGYMQRRVCIVSNYNASRMMSEMGRITAGLTTTGGIWEVRGFQSNSVIVTAPPGDLDRLEAAIHKADAAKELP
jgi:hypothetical protein